MLKPTEQPESHFQTLDCCMKKHDYQSEGDNGDYKECLVCYFLRQEILDQDNNLDKTKLIPRYFGLAKPNRDKSAQINEWVVKKESLK